MRFLKSILSYFQRLFDRSKGDEEAELARSRKHFGLGGGGLPHDREK